MRLAAWKLDKYGRDADGMVNVTSTGSDKYPDGTTVRLPAIDGHRDTNDTACPGSGLRQAAGDPRPDPAAHRQLVKPGAGQNPVAGPL